MSLFAARGACAPCASGRDSAGTRSTRHPQARPVRGRSTRAMAQTQVKVATDLSASTAKQALAHLQNISGSGSRYLNADKQKCIISIGLTIHSCPVEVREKMAVPEAEWPRAIAELTSFPHIEEAAVLSTCNRMEVYVVARAFHSGVREVEEWMSATSGIALEELRPYLFLLRDSDATAHLLRVAAGLDSLVMGEGQILAQVKAVYLSGQDSTGFGRHLNGLFKQAITAGKRVRAETSISTGSVSVSSAAAELVQLKLPTHIFDDARVCIIGAGKMAKLLVKHLASKGCKRLTIVNRSLPRAEALRDEFPEVHMDLRLTPDLMACCAESDVIFAASGSEEILVHAEDAAKLPRCPAVVGGVRRWVDISVPRNIAREVGAVEGEKVFNVDDLKEVVAANKEARAQAAAEAEVLLREEQRAFEGWWDSLETVPTIKALRTKAEDIRVAALEQAMRHLGDGLTKKQQKAVEELSRGIVNKLLHGPMAALRSDGADAAQVAQTLQNMEALDRMFGLAEIKARDAMAKARN